MLYHILSGYEIVIADLDTDSAKSLDPSWAGSDTLFSKAKMHLNSFILCLIVSTWAGVAVPVVFEQSGSVGGTWVYTESVGLDER